MSTASKRPFDPLNLLRASQQRYLVFVSPARALARWAGLLAMLGALWISLFGFGSNLAIGKPVRMSSSCTKRPEHSWAPVQPSRLVDGKKWRPYDTCTEKTPNPWVLIDLKQMVRIDEVVVTGRRDCCTGYRDLPLLLEISRDGAMFQTLVQRDVPVSDRDPWRIELNGTEGRFVRLRIPSKEPREIVLTEVEVFGVPSP